MKKNRFAALALALALALPTALTGCFGSFSATRHVHDWNSEVSDNRFVNWFVFLGMNVIPVYPVAVLADLVVFNTVEFWSGENPTEQVDVDVDRRADGSIEVTRDDRKLVMRAVSERELMIYEDGQAIARALSMPDRTIAVTDLGSGETRTVDADRAGLLSAVDGIE